MAEPGGLPSMASHRAGHDWSDLAAAAADDSSDGKESACNADQVSIPGLVISVGKVNGNPLQYYCLENPMDRGAGRLYSPWGLKESDMTEWLLLTLTHSVLLCFFWCLSVFFVLFCFVYFFNWSVFDSQYCAGSQQSDPVIHICVCVYIYKIYSFSNSFPLWFTIGYWI